MADPVKHEYVLDLSAPSFAAAQRPAASRGDAAIRSVSADDAEALAELMLEAYRDTIDYEGEEIAEAREAIAEFLSEAPLLDASMMATVDGVAASAVLVTAFDDGPFISYVFSHPAHQRRGFADHVIDAAGRRLIARGELQVRFAITDGNLASEALFARLGAVRQ